MVVWFGGQKYGFELKWGDIFFFENSYENCDYDKRNRFTM